MCSAHACAIMRALIFLIVFVVRLTCIVFVELLCFQCLDVVQMDYCIDINVFRPHITFFCIRQFCCRRCLCCMSWFICVLFIMCSMSFRSALCFRFRLFLFVFARSVVYLCVLSGAVSWYGFCGFAVVGWVL